VFILSLLLPLYVVNKDSQISWRLWHRSARNFA